MRSKLAPGRLRLLSQVSLFRGLSNADLARVDRLVVDLAFEPGDVLTTQGRLGQEAFVILSGTASVVIDGVEIAEVGPGEVIGEMALVDRRPRTATVTARTPMVVLVFDQAGFGALLAEAGVSRHVLNTVVRRLRAAETST